MRNAVLLLAALLAPAALAASGLQIHVFDVGQAASELIVFPSGYTILIDCGELSWNSASNANSVAKKISAIRKGNMTIDAAVISHMHLDHIGYIGTGGLWSLLERQGVSFGKIVDRDAGVWKDANKDGACTLEEIEWHNVGVMSNTFTLWVCYATDPKNVHVYNKREVAQLCSKSQIDPPDASASVTITTVDAHGTLMSDKKTPVSGDHSKDEVPPNENDYSVGMLIKFGKFTYSTAGDLDGQYYTAQGYKYNDEESVVMKRVGEVDVLHVNHHGSAHSTNQNWVNTLKPTASVASLGFNNSYAHPDQATLDKLVNSGDVYLTEMGEPSRDYTGVTIANGDIFIDVAADGASYSITAGSKTVQYKSKGAVAPVCKL